MTDFANGILNMYSVKALFVGLNTVDLQFFVNSFPEENTKTKAHRNEIAAGGPATNAAITCSFLGGNSTLITPIGKHSLSEFLVEDILRHKVNIIDPIENIASKPVFASIISNELNGDRTVFSYHPERNDNLLLKDLNLNNLNEFDIVLFDGFYPELSLVLAKDLKSRGVTTVLDGGSWKPGLDELLPYIDIAICSNDFLAPNTKSHYHTVDLLSDYGVEKIAITRGGKSILCFDKGKNIEISTESIHAVDTLGAGDIFHGAFCYYYGFLANFELALRNASRIASMSCKTHGTRSWMESFKLSYQESI